MNSPKLSFRLPEMELAEIEDLIRAGCYSDKTQFLRSAVASELRYAREHKKQMEAYR